MDFSTIKQIVIPEGIVKKIEDGDGNIIWQKSKVLQSITLAGYTTTFNVGNTFSYGGIVTANYSDGTTDDVTANTTFSGYNMSSAGTQTVTASYTEAGVTQTATYSITVYKVLTKITLSGQTTSLNRNATYSFGGTVTATYNDGSTANVTSSTTFSGLPSLMNSSLTQSPNITISVSSFGASIPTVFFPGIGAKIRIDLVCKSFNKLTWIELILLTFTPSASIISYNVNDGPLT